MDNAVYHRTYEEHLARARDQRQNDESTRARRRATTAEEDAETDRKKLLYGVRDILGRIKHYQAIDDLDTVAKLIKDLKQAIGKDNIRWSQEQLIRANLIGDMEPGPDRRRRLLATRLEVVEDNARLRGLLPPPHDLDALAVGLQPRDRPWGHLPVTVTHPEVIAHEARTGIPLDEMPIDPDEHFAFTPAQRVPGRTQRDMQKKQQWVNTRLKGGNF